MQRRSDSTDGGGVGAAANLSLFWEGTARK